MDHCPADHLANYATASWIDQFDDLMVPFERIALSAADAASVLDHARGSRDVLGFSNALSEDLGEVLGEYPRGAHLRLEGCSLRQAGQVPRIATASAAITALSQGNARVAACQALVAAYLDEQSLYLFEWTEIPMAREFRIFVRDRTVVGITPYHGTRGFDSEVYARLSDTQEVLFETASDLIDRAPQATFAADVFLTDDFRTTLIEINPFGPTTGTGLFDNDFDGCFRYPAPQYRQTASAADFRRI